MSELVKFFTYFFSRILLLSQRHSRQVFPNACFCLQPHHFKPSKGIFDIFARRISLKPLVAPDNMPSSEQEFFIADWERWPRSAADAEALLKEIPLVFWRKDLFFGILVENCGAEVGRVTVQWRTGPRVYHVWKFRGQAVIFKEESPPTVIVVVQLAVEGSNIRCDFARMSGEPLAEATFNEAVRPLLMGHVSMVAYRAASDANLIESLYQEVQVLLEGFHRVVPDGVVLCQAWGNSAGEAAETLDASLHRLQRLSTRQLCRFDLHTLPEFLQRNLNFMRSLPTDLRTQQWFRYVYGQEFALED